MNFLKTIIALLFDNRAELDEGQEQGAPAGDDYFSSHTELIDNDGTVIEPGEKTEKEETKGDNVIEEDKTQKGDTDPKQNQEDFKPKDFNERFFERNEKGEVVNFKAEDALGFMIPDKGSEQSFRYNPIHVITEEEAKNRKPEDLPQAPKSIKDQHVELHKHFKEVEDQVMKPILTIAKAIDEGFTPEQALQSALREVREYVTNYQNERKMKFEADYLESLEKKGTSKEAVAKIQQQAQINETKMHQYFGGKDAYESVFFGYQDKDGKFKPGLASEDLWMVFRLSNPGIDEKKMTAKELQQSMSEWYPKFASNMDNLLWLRKIGMATLFEKNKPHIIDAIRRNAQRGNQTKREGTQHKAGGLKTPAKNSGTSALDAFMNPMGDRESIATI